MITWLKQEEAARGVIQIKAAKKQQFSGTCLENIHVAGQVMNKSGMDETGRGGAYSGCIIKVNSQVAFKVKLPRRILCNVFFYHNT